VIVLAVKNAIAARLAFAQAVFAARNKVGTIIGGSRIRLAQYRKLTHPARPIPEADASGSPNTGS